ncbi:MAG: hypothetical protein KDI19_10595, partial [Pseudomonadales bacterium]|nr:hypothetical protein [Pseudomonadales bacterium]
IDMLGVGVSGGAEGARHGASVMVGGDRLVFERLEACFEAMAVQVHGHRCLAHVGPGGAGHFVKMVHNGIEYGAMQVIAEVWQCMESIGFTRSRESELFGQWQSGPAAGFLTSIVAGIVDFADPLADGYLLDQVSDVAGQKGTGRWTLEVALELGVAVPVIAAALEARLLSGSTGRSSGANRSVSSDTRDWPKLLERAVASGMLAAFAQGFDLLSVASGRFGWQLDLPGVAKTWQGGCIIRAAMLEDIGLALTAGEPLVRAPGLANFRDPGALREVVAAMTLAGIAPPAMGAAIAWFDGLESARLPTALIQAQRDYFGAHTYERRDRPGKFTTDWRKR